MWSSACTGYLQIAGTVGRQSDDVALLDVLQHLLVAEALVRETAKCHDLVQQDAVAPDVRLGCEDAVGEGLRGHPAHGQHALPTEAIVVRVVHGPRHAEVADLYGLRGVDKTVTAREVSAKGVIENCEFVISLTYEIQISFFPNSPYLLELVLI